MTPEAKAMVMQLMGQTYGQMKKQDEMIVGQSAQLQAKSGEMKQMVEQLVATPTVASQQAGQFAPQAPQPAPQQAPQPEAAPVPTGPPAGTITPEQAMAELQQAPAMPTEIQVTPTSAPVPVNAAPVVEETMEFDFSEPSGIDKLVELQKETNLLLKAIKLQLENSNVRPKRKSAVKKAKSSIS